MWSALSTSAVSARRTVCAGLSTIWTIGCLALTPLVAQAVPVTGIDFQWDAAGPGATPATTWRSDVGSSNWNVNAAVHVTGPGVSSLPGIGAAYRFDAVNGGMSAGSWSGLPGGNPTGTSSSIEIWFRPDGLLGGRQVIFETGGATDGLSITLNDAQLMLRAKDGGVSVSAVHSLTAGAITEFVQVVAVIELNATVSLYVNGALAAQSAAAGLNDWSGTNGAGLGAANGAVGGNTGGDLNGFDEFSGQIALMRFYGNQILDPAGVARNYASVVVPEPASAVLVALGLACLASGRRVNRRRSGSRSPGHRSAERRSDPAGRGSAASGSRRR